MITMRTRNSSSIIGPDDTTVAESSETSHQMSDSRQQQPLLPPPPPPTAAAAAAAAAARTQHGRRPPSAPPPPIKQQHPQPSPIPPPPTTNRPSEVVRRPQVPPEVSLNVVTSPQSSPTRTVVEQQQRPLPPVLSPLQQQQQQQRELDHQFLQQQHHSPLERLRTTVTTTVPPPPPIHTNVLNTEVAASSQHRPTAHTRVPPEMPVVVETSIHWILQVRLPSSTASVTNNSSDSRTMPQLPLRQPLPIRKIQMTSHSFDIDVSSISNCLQQCLNYYPNNSNNGNSNIIAGLFCETTQTFYSLQHILSWDNTMIKERQQYIYAVELPPVVSSSQVPADDDKEGFWMGWYHYVMDELQALYHSILSNLFILLPIILAIVLYYQYNIVSDSVVLTYTTIYSTMIEQPLRDIYHYGPWFIGGWEGDDISTICARITYHGDAQFWIRNMNECQRIYSAKEQAFIRIVLPFIYLMCIVLFVYTIRFLIQEYQNYQFQLYNNHRNPLERDMADLYHSFHVVLRQILQVHNNNNAQHQQQRPPGLPKKYRTK